MMDAHDTDPAIWTFLPGLHGTEELYESVRERLPAGTLAEFINLPSSGKQDYPALFEWLDKELPKGKKRIIIAESFSGPLAIRLTNKRPDEIAGLVLAATFCDAPINPGFALLPLRPLFMVKPPLKALRHFLIGDDASEAKVAELRSIIQSIPASTLSKRVRTILQLMEQDNPSLPALPMLLLKAGNDNLIPWEPQRKLEPSYPNKSVP